MKNYRIVKPYEAQRKIFLIGLAVGFIDPFGILGLQDKAHKYAKKLAKEADRKKKLEIIDV